MKENIYGMELKSQKKWEKQCKLNSCQQIEGKAKEELENNKI